MTVLLLGTDFSPRSDRALRRAILLARQFGWELRIVGVIEESQSAGSREPRERETADQLARMERTINEMDGLRCSSELRVGHAQEQLAKAAREAGADLIVIGPHRRSLIRDAFGAITAERIVGCSPVPLICANCVPSAPYRRLLLPVDFEEPSQSAVQLARSLGLADEAEIVLLHLYVAEARDMLGRSMTPAEERSAYLARRAAATRGQLRGFAASLAMERATQLAEELRGPVGAEIERIAAEEGADLVVLPRSRKGGIARTILGSATEDLLRSGKFDLFVL